MCPSLIEIGSKTAEKNSTQRNRQIDRHYENNGHLAVNQCRRSSVVGLYVTIVTRAKIAQPIDMSTCRVGYGLGWAQFNVWPIVKYTDLLL